MVVTDFGLNWFRLEVKSDTYLYFRRLMDIENPIVLIKVSEGAFELLETYNLPFSHLVQDNLSTPKRLSTREIHGDLKEKCVGLVREFTKSSDYFDFLDKSAKKIIEPGEHNWVEHNIKTHDGSRILEFVSLGDIQGRGTTINRLIINEHYFPGSIPSPNVWLSSDSRYLICGWYEERERVYIDTIHCRYLINDGAFNLSSIKDQPDKNWKNF